MKTVAILGFAPSSLGLAPFNDPNIELWGLNNLQTAIQANNITRWFDIHGRKQLENMPKNGEQTYLDGIRSLPCPVYMQQVHEDIPNSREFPKDYMVEKYGTYFTNSISWMMAMAIEESYGRIELFGVDMAHGTEYADQRPSCEYFIGLARGKGIEVYIPKESDLLKTSYLYGYEEESITALQQMYKDRIADYDMLLEKNETARTVALMNHGYGELIKENYFLLGAREDTSFYLRRA